VKARRARTPRRRRPPLDDSPRDDEIVPLARERLTHTETSPRLTGGDLDADWHSAWEVGDEAVGGSVATPDQSVVDELGEALGVAQSPDAELQTTSEILDRRDRHRWDLEEDEAADGEIVSSARRRLAQRRRS